LVAKNELVTYLTISAYVESVLTMVAFGNTFENNVFNLVVDVLGPPKIIRVWFLKSDTALASVKNSGLNTTSILNCLFHFAHVPGDTVDLITTVLATPNSTTRLIAFSTISVWHVPFLFIGVGKHINTTSQSIVSCSVLLQ